MLIFRHKVDFLDKNPKNINFLFLSLTLPPLGNLLGVDLSFLRPISIIKRTEVTKGARPTIIVVILDMCSRFVQLRSAPTDRPPVKRINDQTLL